jgi:transcriptional regulator with XRE-family HTH domain
MEILKIAENLKRLRKEKGWSQQELAEKAKLSYNAITKIEQGCSMHPSITTIIKIADAFEVGIEKIIKSI